MIPQLFARLLHYHGTDAKLRAFRHERWIPRKWTNLHQLYARAIELGVARVAGRAPERQGRGDAMEHRAGIRSTRC